MCLSESLAEYFLHDFYSVYSSMLSLPRKLFWTVILTTLLQTTLVLQWSSRAGRLALPVYFDDNHSMVDGARRLEIWYHQGSTAVAKDYIANPPHAPGHSALAMASFALFGFHEWAPYLTNGLFFALILYALLLVLQGMESWLQIACVIFLASTPIAGLSILEFRSEINVAELGALGVILFVAGSRKKTSVRPVIGSALCFASCFIIKPAVFPYTLGLMGLCLIYHLRLFLEGAEGRLSLKEYLRTVFLFLLLAILPPLPHYLIDWHHILSYIQSIAFASSSVWLRHDDLVTNLCFYVTGYPGMIMLGGFLKPSIILIFSGVIVRILWRRSWPQSLPFFSLLYFVAGAYAGVVVNTMNQNYFGMTFHWLLLITALASLCGIITLLFETKTKSVGIGLSALASIVFFAFKFPLSIDFYQEKANGDPATFLWLQESPERVMAPIRRENQNNGATKVWIAAYTMINARTLEWYSLLHHEPFFYRDFIESDWKAVPGSLDWADIVIVPEKGTPSIETIIPNAAMTERMVAQLERDPRFQLLERIPSPHSGPGFRIYAKQRSPAFQ